MNAILNDQVTGKRDKAESSDLMAGAGAVRLVSSGDPAFVADIKAIVPNEDSQISSLKADDSNQTEVSGNLDPTDLNIAGKTLSTGAYIIPHKYENGRSFVEVTCSSGAIWVYYNDKIDRNK